MSAEETSDRIRVIEELSQATREEWLDVLVVLSVRAWHSVEPLVSRDVEDPELVGAYRSLMLGAPDWLLCVRCRGDGAAVVAPDLYELLDACEDLEAHSPDGLIKLADFVMAVVHWAGGGEHEEPEMLVDYFGGFVEAFTAGRSASARGAEFTSRLEEDLAYHAAVVELWKAYLDWCWLTRQRMGAVDRELLVSRALAHPIGMSDVRLG